MMNLTNVAARLCLASLAALTLACGEEDEGAYELTLERSGSLTDAADELLSWRMIEGEPLAMDRIEVFAHVSGGVKTYALRARLDEDADGDGSFGPGDLLTVIEPANIFGAKIDGPSLEIALMRDEGDSVVRELYETTLPSP